MVTPTKGTATKILLVEDDPAIALTLTDVFESSGKQVAHAHNGAEAEALADEYAPDLIVLDLMLPDTDGLVLCANLKSRRNVPIVICSATVRKRDTVLGLKLGADDFISKPFNVDELEARVDAVLRRAGATTMAGGTAAGAMPAAGSTSSDAYKVGDLEIDRSRRRVSLGGQALQLTPTEYRLVSTLASHVDDVLTREELAQQVWGYQDVSVGRAIDVHIRRLRAKLASGPVQAPPIVSVRGFGYKMSRDLEEAMISVA